MLSLTIMVLTLYSHSLRKASLSVKNEPGSPYEAVVALAKAYLGTPYRYGGIDKSGVDCSGLVCRVYLDAAGVRLPRTADAQALVGQPVKKEELQPGDLVFFREPGRRSITHVGIVHKVENQEVGFIHAASVRRQVVEDRLSDPHWQLRFVCARRPVIPSKPTNGETHRSETFRADTASGALSAVSPDSISSPADVPKSSVSP
ncbi:MAG: C40 family peptidase [Bacteroidia bacterium]|nr:C40 family peptidase [Bacteroidia bacterium]